MPPQAGIRGKRKSSTLVEPSDDENEGPHMCFSQQPPETSQHILPAKPSEQRNLDSLPAGQKDKFVMDLSRLLLFKALAGETIDRKLVCKEAGIGPDQGRISTAVFALAVERLKNVFGFDLARLPKWMERQKSTKKKFSERHYLVADAEQDEHHARALYCYHPAVSVEKGLLMVILALVFCKGEQKSDGTRWILDADLYRLLNAVDENIPAEPPAPGAKKGPSSRFQEGQGTTPDVDAQIEKYVKADYLLKEKITEDELASHPTADENAFLYALGPRTALEIGRRQIVYFCAEILGHSEPDQQMLEEIERDEEKEEMEEAEEA